MLVVPLFSTVVVPGAFLTLLLSDVPWIAQLLAQVLDWLLQMIFSLLRYIETLPFALWPVDPLDIWRLCMVIGGKYSALSSFKRRYRYGWPICF